MKTLFLKLKEGGKQTHKPTSKQEEEKIEEMKTTYRDNAVLQEEEEEEEGDNMVQRLRLIHID